MCQFRYETNCRLKDLSGILLFGPGKTICSFKQLKYVFTYFIDGANGIRIQEFSFPVNN